MCNLRLFCLNSYQALPRLFYGKIRQRLTGIDDHRSRSSTHEKEDLFSHLPVNVTDDGVDIYDGLSGYFDDVVEFDGKRARMEVSLVDLPPLLQIQLQASLNDIFWHTRLITLHLFPRGFNSIVKLFSHINLKRM